MNITNHHFKLTLKLSLLLIFFIFGNSNCLDAQDSDYDNNTVYMNYGSVIFTSQISISYERMVFQKDHLRTKLKVNYGKYLSNHADYDTDAKVYENYKSVSGVVVFRKFEANLGLAFTEYTLASGPEPNPETDYSEVLSGTEAYISLGFRHEKDNFIFRAGVGNLELLYAGIGFSF